MHPIDESSPFYGATNESLAAEEAELLVTVTGLDETMSQTIHARASYQADEIRFGRRFVDMFGYTQTGRLVIDYALFNETEPDRALLGAPGQLNQAAGEAAEPASSAG
jgi:inward rectifier potassium channel